MGRVPSAADGVGITRRHAEEIRQLRNRSQGHAEIKTFIVPGDISGLPYVPAVFLVVDPADNLPEVKEIVGFVGVLAAGTATLNWLRNDSLITDAALVSGSDHAIDTTAPNKILLDTPIVVADTDTIRVAITASDGSDLSAGVYLTTRHG